MFQKTALFAALIVLLVGLFTIAQAAAPTLAPLSRSGDGACSAMSAGNGELVVGRGISVELWDVSDTTTPVQLGSIALAGMVLDLSHNGTTIFATVFDGISENTIFYALDFSLPGTPSISDSISFVGENYGWGLGRVGAFYYLNILDVTQIIDLSDPAALLVVGTTRGGHRYAGAGNRLFISTSTKLYALENSTPSAPVDLGNWNVGGSYFIQGLAVTQDGNTAFVTSRGVDVVDTSDPALMVTTLNYNDGHGPGLLHLEGNRLYGVNGVGTVRLLDVTNPLAIFSQGDYAVADGRIVTVSGIATDPSRPTGAVMFARFNEGAVVADTSDPANVARRSFVFTGGAASDFAIIEALPAAKLAGEAARVLTTGNRPTVNSYTINDNNTMGSMTGIAVGLIFTSLLDENYVGIESSTPKSAKAVTLKPHAAESMEFAVGYISPTMTSAAPLVSYAQGMAATNSLVAVASGSSPVQIFNSDMVGLDAFGVAGFVVGVAFGANILATIATSGPSQITVYNMPDQNGMTTEIDAFSTSLYEASAVRIVGNYMFIYNESGGCIQIYEVVNLNAVAFVGEICLPNGSATAAIAAGAPASQAKALASDELYVAGYSHDLHAYDISDINNPMLLGSTQTIGQIEHLEVYNEVLYAAEGGAGMAAYDVSTGISAVDNELSGFPKRATLHANYPNPFNPSTTIKFELPSAGSASLEVFDVAGKRIRKLIGNDLAAGPHEVVWHGRDEAGHVVPSGVYYYRLEAGKFHETKQMVLLK